MHPLIVALALLPFVAYFVLARLAKSKPARRFWLRRPLLAMSFVFGAGMLFGATGLFLFLVMLHLVANAIALG